MSSNCSAVLVAIGDTKWHYSHWKDHDYTIGWLYKGQMEKRNIVTLSPSATAGNYRYFTNDGKAIPKLVYRALAKHQMEHQTGEQQ